MVKADRIEARKKNYKKPLILHIIYIYCYMKSNKKREKRNMKVHITVV